MIFQPTNKRKIRLAVLFLTILMLFGFIIASQMIFRPERGAVKVPGETAENAPPIAAVSEVWLETIQDNILQSEYNINPVNGSGSAEFEAVNRAHNLHTQFTKNGPTLSPQTSKE